MVCFYRVYPGKTWKVTESNSILKSCKKTCLNAGCELYLFGIVECVQLDDTAWSGGGLETDDLGTLGTFLPVIIVILVAFLCILEQEGCDWRATAQVTLQHMK